MRQFTALAGLTLLEAVRQPIHLLLTTSCVMLTILAPMVLMYKFGEDGKLARDAGLALHFLCGVFVAGLAASTTLTREMKSGTASAVLSKPVSRELLFAAKYAGLAGVVGVFSLCATMATLVGERIAERFVSTPTMFGYLTDWTAARWALLAAPLAFVLAGILNYRRRWPFASSAFWLLLAALGVLLLGLSNFDRAGSFAPWTFLFDWRIARVSLLLTLALLVLAALALGLSSRLETVPTLAVCAAVFLAGLLSDYLLGRLAGHSAAASLAYRLLPNWQHFWLCDALDGGGTVPWHYVRTVALYAGAYVAGLLCLGAASFRHAEIK